MPPNKQTVDLLNEPAQRALKQLQEQTEQFQRQFVFNGNDPLREMLHRQGIRVSELKR